MGAIITPNIPLVALGLYVQEVRKQSVLYGSSMLGNVWSLLSPVPLEHRGLDPFAPSDALNELAGKTQE
jgi:hypothetical protein